jgi:glycosyltransferase involved in cell wall biosynthesis
VRLRLVVPENVDEPTGGNTYDLALADALRRGGDEVEMRRCAPGDLESILRQPWEGPTLVDGLLAAPQPEAVTGARVSVLVHMPLALETGLSRDRAAELDRRERRALHAAERVVATSNWTARYLRDHYDVHNVAVATPGVDPAPVVAGSEPPLLVQLAALVPHKDQLTVVAALARVADLSWQARLAGPTDRDPAYAAAVRDAVRVAGLEDRVDIPGTMPREAAWEGADLTLLPSLVESFGLVVVEALARGVPALVGAGGPEEALGATDTGDRPGLVVPPGDPDALGDALRRWLTDQHCRESIRHAALARRVTLEPWDVTARRVRDALTRG